MWSADVLVTTVPECLEQNKRRSSMREMHKETKETFLKGFDVNLFSLYLK